MGTSGKRDGNLLGRRRLKLDKLRRLSTRPRLYGGRDKSFWTDPYVSGHVLEAHLDPHTDDASRRPAHIRGTVEKILEHYNAHVPPATTPRLLDLACGPGLYAEQFAARGFDVTGIDFSAVSIEHAQTEAARQGLPIVYRREDLTTVDPGGPYDIATLIYGEFCTFSEQERHGLLRRIRDSLVPGGLLVLDVFTEAYVRRNRSCDDWYVSSGNGFWQPEPHLVLLQHFHYASANASVARYTLVEENGAYRQFNVWWRHFTASEITELLEDEGYEVEALYGSLWGDPLEPGGEWIGVYARAAT